MMQEENTSGTRRYDVLLFAIVSELANCDVITVEASSAVTAIEMLDAISNVCPALVPWLPSCRLAVNRSFVSDEFLIPVDAEIALIPPVSGG
jgi:molybdopterin converting factor small subunit